jgi:hypothetical protein
MNVTDVGIYILARLIQPENALEPMDVTDVGIVTEIRFLQSLKALLAIDVKLE